jgi:hypothetical protein
LFSRELCPFARTFVAPFDELFSFFTGISCQSNDAAGGAPALSPGHDRRTLDRGPRHPVAVSNAGPEALGAHLGVEAES